MITKRELESIPSLVRQLDYNQKLLDGLSLDVPDGAKGIDYTRDRVQTSCQNIQEDMIVEWLNRMDGVKKRIHGRTKKLQQTLDKAYRFIDSVEDELDKEIVERHCIYGESFYRIGTSIKYSKEGIAKRYYRCLKKYKIR